MVIFNLNPEALGYSQQHQICPPPTNFIQMDGDDAGEKGPCSTDQSRTCPTTRKKGKCPEPCSTDQSITCPTTRKVPGCTRQAAEARVRFEDIAVLLGADSQETFQSITNPLSVLRSKDSQINANRIYCEALV